MTRPSATPVDATFESFARAALPAYGFPPDTPLRLLNVSENGTFAVRDGSAGAGNGEAVLRVHRPGYNAPAMIESELAWLDALRTEAGISTPVPIAATDGRRVVEVACDGQHRHAVLFKRLPGSEPPADELSRWCTLIGEQTARLHVHADRWQPPRWFSRFSWDIEHTVGASGRWGAWRNAPGMTPAVAQVLQRACERVQARLAAYGAGRGRYGLIHADLRLANLLLDGERVHVIDFDDCGYGWNLYDFGTAVSFLEHDPRLAEWFDRWLTGYERVRTLADADIAEVPTFVMLRRLMLTAWIGSHPTTELARTEGAGYVRVSADVAERYLSGSLL